MIIKGLEPPGVIVGSDSVGSVPIKDSDVTTVSQIDTGSSAEDEQKSPTHNPEKSRFAKIYDLIQESQKRKSKSKGNLLKTTRVLRAYKRALSLEPDELKNRGGNINVVV